MPFYVSNRERWLWFWLLTLVLTIYSTVGLTRPITSFLRDHGLLEMIYLICFGLVLIMVLLHGLLRRSKKKEWILWLCILAVYLMCFVRIEIPEERTHLIEYGAVAILLLEIFLERKSAGKSIPNPAILSILFTTLIGIVDEGIQFFVPSRVFDIRDIIFNFVAALLSVSASELLRWARKGMSQQE